MGAVPRREDESYPEEALQADLEDLRSRVERMRADLRTPDTTLSDDPNSMNPATTDALVRLMLGGLPVGRTGYPLHCRLRYFDPTRRRAGLPEQVAALVERMTEDDVTVQLVNLDPITERTVIVQGGAYAEHQITTVRQEDGAGSTAVDHPHFAVRLSPGAGARLVVGMQRYANQPTLSFPWMSAQRLIDTHVHVFCLGNRPGCRPARDSRIEVPTTAVPVEWLLDDMQQYGIAHAVIVQSSAFGTDNRYIVQSVRRYPEQLRGIGLIDPLDADAPSLLNRWASRGLSGFRFHPVYFDDASWLDAPSSDRIWEAAEGTGSILQFHMLPHHASQLASIASRHPEVRVIVDHLGKPDPGDTNSDVPVLELASLPNIWIKIGDYQVASRESYPWQDIWPFVRRLRERFGTTRMIWGTGYPGAARLVPMDQAIDFVTTRLGLSTEAVDDILWQTPRALFGFN